MTDQPDRVGDDAVGSADLPANQRNADRPQTTDARSPATRGRNTDQGLPPTHGPDDGSRARDPPNLVTVLASTAGFEAGIWVVLRYVPEYLRSLGVGVPLIGALGSLWLIGRWFTSAGIRRRPLWIAFGAVAAAAGLTLWALVPALAGESETSAWVLVVAGAVGIAAWSRAGTNRAVGRWPLADVDGTAWPDGFGWTLAALAVSLPLLALARSFQAGFRIVLVLAAALGVTVAALWAVGDLEVSPPDQLSTRTRARAHVGDVICRFGLAMVSMFVVVVVTTVSELEIVVLGRRLAPATTFGLYLVAESLAAALMARFGPRVVDGIGARAAAVYSSVVAAGFPLVLVSAPANPVAVGAVFVAYGTRSLGQVARRRTDALHPRPAILAGQTAVPAARAEGSGRLTTDRRHLAVVVAPLLGGLLYAVSPVLAFGTATAVAAVGTWELTRAVAGP